MEAIQVSTINAARLLKMDHLVGSLEAGKLADFVMLDGNPLDDIRLVQDKAAIRSVVLGGTYVKKDGNVLIGTAFA